MTRRRASSDLEDLRRRPVPELTDARRRAAPGDDPFRRRPIEPDEGVRSSLYTNLISYWQLEETSGQRLDSHGANHLTPQGNTLPGNALGIQGMALALDDSNFQHVQCASNTSLVTGNISCTLAGWAYFDSLSNNRILASRYGSTNSDREYLLQYSNATNRLTWRWHRNVAGSNVTVTANTFGGLTASTWYFLVVYHNATLGQIGISVNGGAFDTASAVGGNVFGQAHLVLGSSDGLNTPHAGRLDEWGFWKRLLTAAEIDSLYGNGGGRLFPFR